jgi:hypothetical protein
MWGIFLVYPLIALIFAIKKYKYKDYRIFILLFFCLYGYTYIPIPNSDSTRYMVNYIQAGDYTLAEYSEDVQDVFNGKAEEHDVYAITLKFVSFLFSTNYKFFFLLAAVVYFSVILKFLSDLWEFIKERQIHYYLSYFIGCCFVYNISAGVNGVRFPLAFFVFTYGAMNLILKDHIKYLFIASLSILIHFALSFSVIFLFVFYLIRYYNNKNILFAILFLVYITSNAFPSLISSYLGFLGDSMESQVTGYTNETYMEGREAHAKNWNWYVQFNALSTYYFCFVTVVLSKLKKFDIKFDEVSNRLFGFTVIMIIHSLLSGSVVDSISNRYNNMVSIFGLIYLFYLTSQNYENKYVKYVNYVYMPILIINILVKMRVDLDTISPVLVFGNAIIVFFVDATQSIQELILG